MRAALRAADAGNAVRRHFSMPEGSFDRIALIAVGKASSSMARAVQEKVPQLDSTLVVTKRGHAVSAPHRCEVIEAGHPVPDEGSTHAASAIQQTANLLGERDLLILAVSGGASALLSSPIPPVTLQDKQNTTELLLRAGATITELNTVRKHLSALKGGGLAAAAYPARVVGLLLSDVIGDPQDVIGSGLSSPDPTTFAEAVAVLRKYGILGQVPSSVIGLLHDGVAGKRPETPKPGAEIFGRVTNIIVGSNALALDAAAQEAQALGYETIVLSSEIEGEAKQVARNHVALLRKSVDELPDGMREPLCILSGGEPTVTVVGSGKGGRNQEFALAAALALDGWIDSVVLSVGTDGTDGPTDAAGALASNDTVPRARQLGLEPLSYLSRNDSYSFFEALGDLIKTGPTDTNVMDIHIMLARRS